MTTRSILVDGNNLIHRAAAVFVKDRQSDPMTSPSGYPTGLVFGSLSMLSDWVLDVSSPSRMDVFFDGVPRRRLDLDPTYKQKDRSERPGSSPFKIRLSDGFEAQNELDLLSHVFRLLGADVYHHPDEEADDLIATYVAKNPDDVHIIMSSDRDFYQILAKTDKAVLYRPGVPGNRFFDADRAADDMYKKYSANIPPSNIRMFKALTGDSSDGIQGVPRLRKKVAAPLCSCSSVDELYGTGLPGFSKVEKEKTLSMRERVDLNWRLVGFNEDIDIASARLPSHTDFAAASRILREDLGITSVCAGTFQFVPDRVRTSGAYDLLPDFLKDI